jgi:hypothetical protein
LVTELTKLIPDITLYPVNYPVSQRIPHFTCKAVSNRIFLQADFSGCATEQKGVADILKHIEAISKACPKQKYVLGGNSQGGVVTTQAVPKIPKALAARVIAITMFGAPACLPEVKEKCRSYCNAGDDVSDASFSGVY